MAGRLEDVSVDWGRRLGVSAACVLGAMHCAVWQSCSYEAHTVCAVAATTVRCPMQRPMRKHGHCEAASTLHLRRHSAIGYDLPHERLVGRLVEWFWPSWMQHAGARRRFGWFAAECRRAHQRVARWDQLLWLDRHRTACRTFRRWRAR